MDEVTKRVADLKLWVESRISELEGELLKLRDMLTLVDSHLRDSSFKTAADFIEKLPATQEDTQKKTVDQETDGVYQEIHPLKRAKNGYLLGNAYVSPSSIVFVPANEVKLNIEIPPFKSFFVSRILEGMKTKDLESVAQNKLPSSQVINYQIEEQQGLVKKIIINTYREKNRLDEILNTLIWAITRMLEKSRPD